MRLGFIVTAACVLAAVVACGDDGSSSPDEADATVKIAIGEDFAPFHTWEQFQLPDDPAADDGLVHLPGPKTEYLNQRPPKGSTSFPVGTIIVKELLVGALGDHKIFAMVKRGGGFNPSAAGWEFFELQQDQKGVFVKYLWRGEGPPVTADPYSGDIHACTDCHGAIAKTNDFVPSAPLQLANF